jgi:hypothetical protein
MTYLENFMHHPGGENERGGGGKSETSNQNTPTPSADEKKESKPILEKIKEALQDWSNKDEADLQFDDTRV